MRNLIGISGKIGSGKDTAALIIQQLTLHPDFSDSTIAHLAVSNPKTFNSSWSVRKFAGKLKEVASHLTGIPVFKFEDQDFKKTYLGPEWNFWTISIISDGKLMLQTGRYTSREQAESVLPTIQSIYGTFEVEYTIGMQQMTVRQFLQELGTEAMRNGLHPNVWVNATFSSFSPTVSKWLITDVRFPNEAEAVKSFNGVMLRIQRDVQSGDHPSEISLDDYQFDYVIENNGTLEELVAKLREFCTTYNIFDMKEEAPHVEGFF